MPITIPSIPNPYSSTLTYTNAYGRIALLSFEQGTNSGSVVFNIHPESASYGVRQPILQVSLRLGSPYDTGTLDGNGNKVFVTIPNLNQTISANTSAFNALKNYFEGYAIQLPPFRGGSIV